MHTLQTVANWLFDNAPGILSGIGAFMAWQKSRQNGKKLDSVHESIAVDRGADAEREVRAAIAAAETRAARRGGRG